MKTAATTSQTSGGHGWMRTVLLAACLALLAVAAPPRSAAAEAIDIKGATQTQQAVCEAGGGVTDTETQQFGGVDIATKTACKGGLLDGMTCTNTLVNDTTKCAMSLVRPIDVSDVPLIQWSSAGSVVEVNVDQIISGLEAGETVQEILPGAETGSPAGQDVVALDDHAPDEHKAKAKGKGKKGKKGGKGRKGRK